MAIQEQRRAGVEGRSRFLIGTVMYLVTVASFAGTKGYELSLDRPSFARDVQRAVARGQPEAGQAILSTLDVNALSAGELKWFYHVSCYTAVELAQYQKAVEICTRSIKNSSEFYQDYVNRGAAHEMIAAYDEAIADYQEAIRRGGNRQQLRRVINAIQTERVKQNAE